MKVVNVVFILDSIKRLQMMGIGHVVKDQDFRPILVAKDNILMLYGLMKMLRNILLKNY